MEGPQATVLAVDDSEDILGLIGATLGREHRVKLAPDGATALRLAFEEPRPDLILLDVEMPEASGYEVCKTLKASPAVADVAVIFLSGHADPRDVVQGFRLGAVDYLSKPINPPVLAMRVRAHLELIARRNRQDELIRERTAQLEQTRLQLIRRLGRVMEYHETSAVGNRVVRLGHYARALAQAAGARPLICDLIMKAAPLHDIGKVGVPAQLLRKAGALSAPEREQMQRHPEIGAEIIGEHDDQLLKLARTLALAHHERWDGGGYPGRLRGADIPWAGRVMAIVDAFESMTTTQFHRAPMTFEQAAKEIANQSGKQFDPAMVQALGKALPEFRRILQTYRDHLGDMLNLDFATRPLQVEMPSPQDKAEIDARSARAMRDADAERAKALAEAHARLQKEHELGAAEATRLAAEEEAKQDAVQSQAARPEAEAAPAEAEPEAQSLDLAPVPVSAEDTAVEAPSEPWDQTIRLPREPAAQPEAETAPAEAAPEKQGLDLTLEPVAPEEKAVDLLLESTRPVEVETAPAGPERIGKVLEEIELNAEVKEQASEPVEAAEAEPAPTEPELIRKVFEDVDLNFGAEEKAPELAPEPAAVPEAETQSFDLAPEPETPSTDKAAQRLAKEERAGQAALQAQAENERETHGAQEKAAADETLAARAVWRLRAEESLAKSARARAAAEARAAQAARTRATAEMAALQAAQLRRKTAAAATEAARRAAANLEALRQAASARAAAEAAAQDAEDERTLEESATLKVVQDLEAAEARAARAVPGEAAAPSAAAQVRSMRPARRIHLYLALALALCAAALGYIAHRPPPIVAQALPARPAPSAAVAPPPLFDAPGGAPLVLRLDRQLRFVPWTGTGRGAESRP
jgi:cyclic di-GMP phosphodiesterase